SAVKIGTDPSPPYPTQFAANRPGGPGSRESHQVLEGCILADSRRNKTDSSRPQSSANNSVPGAPNRISFAKLREPLEVPGLLDVQTESFEWLIGSERRGAHPQGRGGVTPGGGPESAALARQRQGAWRCQSGGRPRRGPRRAFADRGLLRLDVAVVLRPALRRG